MPISKQQWKQLERELSQSWVSVRMKYKGYDLYIARVNLSESQTALAVYVDDVINAMWGYPNREVEGKPSIVEDVWRKRSMACFKPLVVKDIEKALGKREAKKRFPKLHDRIEYYESCFPKASVLCRQFKKLEGLEWVKEEGYVAS
ncbi:hypothetical protein L1D34_07150 [Vibrio mediterranei]|uniref:hypothetical protein n=1 Tax=Vibrio mediterranei TaxID=689 RepID=UPI001EFCFA9E|nr:hypothetical protein [Vibrio mediterranei]MCG9624615.1 hypothetical protein [Vibrio mediterranei]